jgi:hypothetical protein
MEKQSRAWGAEARLKFIEFRLYWEGRINRGDLQSHFGISTPQASLDLKAYTKLAPGNFYYDKQRKAYFSTNCFKPVLISPNAKDYLSQLELISTENDSPFSHASFIGEIPSFDITQSPRRIVDAETLRTILRAINENIALEIQYQSMSRIDPIWRWIAPHALASDGFRWHIRAYCFEKNKFIDFVFGRILGIRAERESKIDSSADLEWDSWLELKIGPNPALSEAQRKGIELDYGMREGTTELVIREALRHYVKQQLGLNNQIPEGEAAPKTQQICLISEKKVAA